MNDVNRKAYIPTFVAVVWTALLMVLFTSLVQYDLSHSAIISKIAVPGPTALFLRFHWLSWIIGGIELALALGLLLRQAMDVSSIAWLKTTVFVLTSAWLAFTMLAAYLPYAKTWIMATG
jgi:hypothetical protein